MALIDDFLAQYRLDFPAREGRPIPWPDYLPSLLKVLERKFGGKIDRLLPVSRETRQEEGSDE